MNKILLVLIGLLVSTASMGARYWTNPVSIKEVGYSGMTGPSQDGVFVVLEEDYTLENGSAPPPCKGNLNRIGEWRDNAKQDRFLALATTAAMSNLKMRFFIDTDECRDAGRDADIWQIIFE